MDLDTLTKIISRSEETEKIEFKIKLHEIYDPKPTEQSDEQQWKDKNNKQWAELVKDILSIANGNIGTKEETGYLIIGVGKELKNGKRDLNNIETEVPSQTELLHKIKSYCQPPLTKINCEKIPIDDKKILVITIPPSPYLHRLSRQLKTPNKEFSPHTALIRNGVGEIYEASDSEKEIIEREKRNSSSELNNSLESRQKTTLEVYEKRIQIYRITRDFLSLVMLEGTVTPEQLQKFSRDTDEALFLFDQKISSYLEDFYSKSVKLYSSSKRLSSYRPSHASYFIDEEFFRLGEEESQLLIWFSSQYEAMRNIFYQYISF